MPNAAYRSEHGGAESDRRCDDGHQYGYQFNIHVHLFRRLPLPVGSYRSECLASSDTGVRRGMAPFVTLNARLSLLLQTHRKFRGEETGRSHADSGLVIL